MPDQKRHEDQQREQRAPGRDQDRNSQNMGNRDRQPGQGNRADQDQSNRDRGQQDRGNTRQNTSDQSQR